MAIISTKDLDIYFERSTPRANGPLLFIGGTGGDLRNKPNQLDSPLSEHLKLSAMTKEDLVRLPSHPVLIQCNNTLMMLPVFLTNFI